MAVFATLHELVNECDVAFSFVAPDAAEGLADQVAQAARGSRLRLFVDGNSIAPRKVRAIADRAAACGLGFVDLTVHGQARRLETMATVYASGPLAGYVAGLLGPPLRYVMLGMEPGAASAIKMLLGAVSKSLVALFLEVGNDARQYGVLPEFLGEVRHFYPALTEAVERMAPTYPRHAARRVSEVSDIEEMVCDLGLRAMMLSQTGAIIERLADLRFADDGSEHWPLDRLIETTWEQGLLRPHGATNGDPS